MISSFARWQSHSRWMRRCRSDRGKPSTQPRRAESTARQIEIERVTGRRCAFVFLNTRRLVGMLDWSDHDAGPFNSHNFDRRARFEQHALALAVLTRAVHFDESAR